MKTKINESKVMGDGTVKAKIRSEGTHYVVEFNATESEGYKYTILDDWCDIVGTHSSLSLFKLFQSLADDMKCTLTKLTDVIEVVELSLK